MALGESQEERWASVIHNDMHQTLDMVLFQTVALGLEIFFGAVHTGRVWALVHPCSYVCQPSADTRWKNRNSTFDASGSSLKGFPRDKILEGHKTTKRKHCMGKMYGVCARGMPDIPLE